MTCTKRLILTLLSLSFFSINAQAKWEEIHVGDDLEIEKVQFIDSFAWVVASKGNDGGGEPLENNLFTTTDGGISWVKNKSLPTKHIKLVNFIGHQTGWVIGDNMLFYTDNSGGTWHHLQTVPLSINLTKIDFIDKNRGWVLFDSAVEKSIVYATQDGGQSWYEEKAIVATGRESFKGPDLEGSEISFTTINGVTQAVSLRKQEGWGTRYELPYVQKCGHNRALSHILHTVDRGKTVTKVGQLCDSVTDINFLDSQHGWLINNRYTIMSTTDGGKTWVKELSRFTFGGYHSISALHMLNPSLGWAIVKGKEQGSPYHTYLLKYTFSKPDTDSLPAIKPCPSAADGVYLDHISISPLIYNSPSGTQHLQAEFTFYSDDDKGRPLWQLDKAIPCSNTIGRRVASVSRNLTLYVPNLDMSDSSGGEIVESAFIFIGKNKEGKLLWRENIITSINGYSF